MNRHFPSFRWKTCLECRDSEENVHLNTSVTWGNWDLMPLFPLVPALGHMALQWSDPDSVVRFLSNSFGQAQIVRFFTRVKSSTFTWCGSARCGILGREAIWRHSKHVDEPRWSRWTRHRHNGDLLAEGILYLCSFFILYIFGESNIYIIKSKKSKRPFQILGSPSHSLETWFHSTGIETGICGHQPMSLVES